MRKVTVDDLRELLAASLAEPVLVLTEGRLRVEPPTAGRPASDVVTRSELRRRLGDAGEPGNRDLELIAATLTTAVGERGA
ncbi:hypothetical protein [Amycolatopsis sp. NPDC051372]|uniref:hypothetical protein n=1 Tax=unclassified Amycolatopsis TaxID=2618356 RepID=UPI0034226494